MQDDGAESMLPTMIMALVVAGIGYFLFFPRNQEQHVGRQPVGQGQGDGQRAQVRPNRQLQRPQQNIEDEDDIRVFLRSHLKIPPHCLSEASNPPLRLAQDGIVPFRSTKASTFEQSTKDSSQTLENRKDRARLFAKIFINSDTSPPARGKNIIVSLTASECENENTHRALFLIGTYYNAFVMIGIDNAEHINDYEKDEKRTSEIVSKFYSSDILPREVLPAHRIVVTRSLASRIAFVRSFPKSPELVMAGKEEELSSQLSKFGYKVILRSVTNP